VPFKIDYKKLKEIRVVTGILIVLFPAYAHAGLFGYMENERSNLQIFPQWLSVLERSIEKNTPEGDCANRKLDQCHLKNWYRFIKSIQDDDVISQLRDVNRFANKQQYILDIENYGIEDYWATPREFLQNSGDCEDYAIIKMLTLKKLGYEMGSVRLVVLQDTNLRIPHAVLSVKSGEDILILDNQIEEVISHKHIVHYVPVYAINENKWWMFLPK